MKAIKIRVNDGEFELEKQELIEILDEVLSNFGYEFFEDYFNQDKTADGVIMMIYEKGSSGIRLNYEYRKGGL